MVNPKVISPPGGQKTKKSGFTKGRKKSDKSLPSYRSDPHEYIKPHSRHGADGGYMGYEEGDERGSTDYNQPELVERPIPDEEELAVNRRPPTAADDVVLIFIDNLLPYFIESWETEPCVRMVYREPSPLPTPDEEHSGDEEEALEGEEVMESPPGSVPGAGGHKSRSSVAVAAPPPTPASTTASVLGSSSKRHNRMNRTGSGKRHSVERRNRGARGKNTLYTSARPSTVEELTGEGVTATRSMEAFGEGGEYGLPPPTQWRLEDIKDEMVRVVFINGNTYEGRVSRRLPEGEGTYTWDDDGIYEGEWEAGRPTGRGMITWPDLSWYEGEVWKGFRHGPGSFLSDAVSVAYVGEWKAGKRDGRGVFCPSHRSDDFYEGDWRDDCMHGKGLRVYPTGETYLGQWENGMRYGQGIMVWPNGDVYRGHWAYGEMDGRGTYTWCTYFNDQLCFPRENLYRGMWWRGLRQGVGVFEASSGGAYYGWFDNDMKHGAGIVVCSNGKSMKGDPIFYEDRAVKDVTPKPPEPHRHGAPTSPQPHHRKHETKRDERKNVKGPHDPTANVTVKVTGPASFTKPRDQNADDPNAAKKKKKSARGKAKASRKQGNVLNVQPSLNPNLSKKVEAPRDQGNSQGSVQRTTDSLFHNPGSGSVFDDSPLPALPRSFMEHELDGGNVDGVHHDGPNSYDTNYDSFPPEYEGEELDEEETNEYPHSSDRNIIPGAPEARPTAPVGSTDFTFSVPMNSEETDPLVTDARAPKAQKELAPLYIPFNSPDHTPDIKYHIDRWYDAHWRRIEEEIMAAAVAEAALAAAEAAKAEAVLYANLSPDDQSSMTSSTGTTPTATRGNRNRLRFGKKPEARKMGKRNIVSGKSVVKDPFSKKSRNAPKKDYPQLMRPIRKSPTTKQGPKSDSSEKGVRQRTPRTRTSDEDSPRRPKRRKDATPARNVLEDRKEWSFSPPDTCRGYSTGYRERCPLSACPETHGHRCRRQRIKPLSDIPDDPQQSDRGTSSTREAQRKGRRRTSQEGRGAPRSRSTDSLSTPQTPQRTAARSTSAQRRTGTPSGGKSTQRTESSASDPESRLLAVTPTADRQKKKRKKRRSSLPSFLMLLPHGRGYRLPARGNRPGPVICAYHVDCWKRKPCPCPSRLSSCRMSPIGEGRRAPQPSAVTHYSDSEMTMKTPTTQAAHAATRAAAAAQEALRAHDHDKHRQHESRRKTAERSRLERAVRRNAPALRDMYRKYAECACDDAPPVPPALVRIFFWQMMRDCELPGRGVSLVELDRRIAENPATLVRNPHDPFEKIYFWQLILFILEVAWIRYIKPSLVPGSAEEACGLADGFQRVIREDLVPNAGNHVGRALFEYRDILPIGPVYEVYKVVGCPHSVRDLLAKVLDRDGTWLARPSRRCWLPNAPNPIAGAPRPPFDQAAPLYPLRLSDFPYFVAFGRNAVAPAGEARFFPGPVSLMEPRASEARPPRATIAPGDEGLMQSIHRPYYPRAGVGDIVDMLAAQLAILHSDGSTKLLKLIVKAIPDIEEEGDIINIDYELTMLEFDEVLLVLGEAAAQVVRLQGIRAAARRSSAAPVNRRSRLLSAVRESGGAASASPTGSLVERKESLASKRSRSSKASHKSGVSKKSMGSRAASVVGSEGGGGGETDGGGNTSENEGNKKKKKQQQQQSPQSQKNKKDKEERDEKSVSDSLERKGKRRKTKKV